MYTFQHSILLFFWLYSVSYLSWISIWLIQKCWWTNESFANNRIERKVSVGSKCPSFKFLFLRTQVKLCKFKHVYTCVHFAGTCVFSESNIIFNFFHKGGPPSLIYGQTFIRKNMDVWVGWIIFKQGNTIVFLPLRSWFLLQIFEVP